MLFRSRNFAFSEVESMRRLVLWAEKNGNLIKCENKNKCLANILQTDLLYDKINTNKCLV